MPRGQLQVEQKLERIKLLTRIINVESCLQIYSHLLLFGQATPARLRETTGISKATLFRNLALLLDAEIIDKVDNKFVEDQRYSIHYFIKTDILEGTKTLYSPEVAEYASKRGQMDVIANWARSIQALPTLLTQLSNELIPHVAQLSCVDGTECVAVIKMLSFRVGEANDLKELLKGVTESIEEFDSTRSTKRRNMKEPLQNPVVFSFSMTAIGIENDTVPKGAIVMQYTPKEE